MPRWDINRRWTPQEWFGPDVDTARLPLGMRLSNNPFNIKYTGSPYQRRTFFGVEGPSEARDQGDPQIRFANPLSGVASGIRLGLTKQSQGLKSVRDLIAHPSLGWTPGNVSAAENVARAMGVDPDAPIELRDPATAQKWSRALISQEHGDAGRLYDDELIRRGVEIGLGDGAAPAPGPRIESGASGQPAAAPQTASFAGPAAMPQPGASFAPMPSGYRPEGQNQGFDLNNWVSSPLFMMGAGILGSGNVGQGVMQGAQASQAMGMNRLKMQTFQDARSEKLRRDQIWGSIFPGGRPNAEHPLLKGVPPELQALAFARGSEQGLSDLQDYQMKRASSRIALDAEAEKRAQMMKMAGPLFGLEGEEGASPRTGTAPVPAAAAMPAAAGVAPPTPLAPTDRRAGVMNDPNLRRIVLGNLAFGNTEGALDALEGAYKGALDEERKIAAEQRAEQTKLAVEHRAPALEEAKKLGEERGKFKGHDENATKAAREMWRYVEQLDDAANALGDDRLWHATSPTLDERSWYNVPGHVAAWTSAERWNDRQKLLGYIDNIVVQARQTQRGLGTLTEGEQATLERAYAGMKSATNPQAFRDAIENLRAVLANKIPERAGYQPEWVKKGLAERAKEKATFRKQQQPAELAALENTLAGQYAALAPPDATSALPTREPTPADVGATPESPRRIDLIPPDPSSGRRVDTLTSVKEGAAVYDTQTGRWGKVIDGDFMSRKEIQRRAMAGRFRQAPGPQRQPARRDEDDEDERARRRADIERQMAGPLAQRARYQRGLSGY